MSSDINPSPNVVFLSFVGLIVAMIVGGVAAYVLIPDSTVAGPLSAMLVGMIPGILASLYAIVRIDAVKADTSQLKRETDKILNGHMDEKIKRNVHDALNEREVS